jgi:hypothetical protein
LPLVGKDGLRYPLAKRSRHGKLAQKALSKE